jgi:glutamate 5-kinase
VKIDRKPYPKGVKRAVIKIGSGVLTRKNGLNLNVIDDLATEICGLRKKGIEIILVSSGAIAAGMKKAGLSKRPSSLSQKQALAANGQSTLVTSYEDAFSRHGAKAAQILLTRDDLTHRRRYLNVRNTLFTLLAWRIIPGISARQVGIMILFSDFLLPLSVFTSKPSARAIPSHPL